MRRIFRTFASGTSPKAIAKRLNAEGVPGPRGERWRDTTIRGHRTRGTGILNNQLFIGRLVWSRLRYVKDPATGRRVSRPNPPQSWITREVPELRIVDDALWEQAKARQAALDATPQVTAIKASHFWERRRARHLLTCLVHCGACGSGFASLGRDYIGCASARKLGTCDARRLVRRGALEEQVLELLRTQLMQPEAVAEFMSAYHAEINAGRAGVEADRARQQSELGKLRRQLDGLYEAIADGSGRRGSGRSWKGWRRGRANSKWRWKPRPRRRYGSTLIYRKSIGRRSRSSQSP